MTAAGNNDIANFIFMVGADTPYLHQKSKNVNIRRNYPTLKRLSQYFSHRLGFNVNITNPYKLIDFKPALGYLFEDVIKDYSHWAFGDLDVVWGDLKSSLSSLDLAQEFILYHRWQAFSGALTIFRNVPALNRNLTFGHPNHIFLLSYPTFTSFDEHFASTAFMYNCNPLFNGHIYTARYFSDDSWMSGCPIRSHGDGKHTVSLAWRPRRHSSLRCLDKEMYLIPTASEVTVGNAVPVTMGTSWATSRFTPEDFDNKHSIENNCIFPFDMLEEGFLYKRSNCSWSKTSVLDNIVMLFHFRTGKYASNGKRPRVLNCTDGSNMPVKKLTFPVFF
jgi:hypothetical protein